MSQLSIGTPLAHEQYARMSYDDFLASVDEDVHAEWFDGQVVVFMPPTTIHQEVVGFLHILLGLYVRLFDLGRLLVAPFEMRADPGGAAREPDLLFVAQAHLEYLTPDRLDGAADLVIEVISDSSVVRDRVDKFYEYQAAGVREYWLIDPRAGKERVDLYWLTPEGRYQAIVPDAEGRYYSVVLDGFWFRPEWLLQEPRPDPLHVLAEMTPQALRAVLERTRDQ
jgi:Uma2 family endonuclease